MICRPASLLLFVLIGSLHAAEFNPVRIRVEKTGKSDTTSYKTVQTRSLTISVSNSSQEPLELKVKYAIFGRDIKTKEVVVVAEGELPVSVKAQETEKVETPLAHAVSEESRVGSKGKTEDAGNRIIGHGVQVWKGAVMLAEDYDPASLKESFGKVPPAKLIEKKKK
jgi:hypothetical protein